MEPDGWLFVLKIATWGIGALAVVLIAGLGYFLWREWKSPRNRYIDEEPPDYPEPFNPESPVLSPSTKLLLQTGVKKESVETLVEARRDCLVCISSELSTEAETETAVKLEAQIYNELRRRS